MNRHDHPVFFFGIKDLLPAEFFIARIFLIELVKNAVFSLVVCQIQDVGLTRLLLLRLRLLCGIIFLIGKHLVFELGEVDHRKQSLMDATVLLLIDALILRISVEKRLNLVLRVLLSQLSINQLVENVDICAENRSVLQLVLISILVKDLHVGIQKGVLSLNEFRVDYNLTNLLENCHVRISRISRFHLKNYIFLKIDK